MASELVARPRPMGIGDLLDETFRLYRQNFLLLISISAGLLIPLEVLTIVMAGLGLSDVIGPLMAITSPEDFSAVMERLLQALPRLIAGIVVLSILSLLAYLVTFGATAFAASEIYHARQPSVSNSYQAGLGIFWRMVRISILEGLALVLLFVVITILTFVAAIFAIMIIPGILFALYLVVAWSLAWIVPLFEGGGARRALGRSRRLIGGYWWRTLALIIVMILLLLVIQAIPSTIAQVLITMVMASAPPGSEGAALALSWIGTSLASTTSTIVFGPISYVVLTLYYYDLRIRKEAYDLELAAQRLAGTQPASFDQGRLADLAAFEGMIEPQSRGTEASPETPPSESRVLRPLETSTLLSGEEIGDFPGARSAPPPRPGQWLVAVDGPVQGRSFALVAPLTRIGRSMACEVSIDDSTIDYEHARIRRQENGWLIENAWGSGGIYLNGQPLTETRELRDGDTIQLGSTRLRFEAGE